MIPVIYRKSDYLKTLQYVLGKNDAQIIDSNLGGNEINEFNKQFLANRLIRSELTNPCAHLILSIANKGATKESLTNQQWTNVARKYLQQLEYLPNNKNGVPSQYVAVRHHDREHEHLHIITSQIRLDGSKVNDSFNYFKAQTATRLIAHEMGLEVTPTSCSSVSEKLKEEYGIDAVTSDNRSKSIRQINRKGNEPSAKDIIKESLFAAIDKSHSVNEFLNALEEKQVYPIVRLDNNFSILGFAYTHKGVTVAGNQVSKKLSWGKLKDTIKFDISSYDLQLILAATEKGLANISKHKSKLRHDSEDIYQHTDKETDSDSSSDERNSEGGVVKNDANTYVSVIPSISDIFRTPTKGKEKSDKPISSDNQSSEQKVTPTPGDGESSNTDVVKNNANTYISVIPSISDIFPSPTNDMESSDKPINDDNQSRDVQVTPPSNYEQSGENSDSNNSSLNSLTTLNAENKIINQNICIGNVQQCVRTIAAYMAFTNKTEMEGDTLSARLDGDNLVLQDKRSHDILLETTYSTQTNQWTVEQSALLTEEHLKRIAQLQKYLPKYTIQTQSQTENTSGIDK